MEMSKSFVGAVAIVLTVGAVLMVPAIHAQQAVTTDKPVLPPDEAELEQQLEDAHKQEHAAQLRVKALQSKLELMRIQEALKEFEHEVSPQVEVELTPTPTTTYVLESTPKKQERQRWEYFAEVNGGPLHKHQLDLRGEDGWELVSFLGSNDVFHYVFKRPKQ
jgi:hypothetical protein